MPAGGSGCKSGLAVVRLNIFLAKKRVIFSLIDADGEVLLLIDSLMIVSSRLQFNMDVIRPVCL